MGRQTQEDRASFRSFSQPKGFPEQVAALFRSRYSSSLDRITPRTLSWPNPPTRTVEGIRRPAERTYGSPADPHKLGCFDRHRPDRGPARDPRDPGVQGLLLLGRPHPRRPRRHAKPLLADLSLRRPRRSRDARSIPRRGRDHPPRSAELDRPGRQPRRPATAGIAGTSARPPRHPRLAARPPHPADLRTLHPTGSSWVRLVGSRIELPADARRNGMGMRRRHPAGAHRQSALRRHRAPRLSSAACSSSRSPPSFRSSLSRSPHCSPTSPETHPRSEPSGVAGSGSGSDRSR